MPGETRSFTLSAFALVMVSPGLTCACARPAGTTSASAARTNAVVTRYRIEDSFPWLTTDRAHSRECSFFRPLRERRVDRNEARVVTNTNGETRTAEGPDMCVRRRC